MRAVRAGVVGGWAADGCGNGKKIRWAAGGNTSPAGPAGPTGPHIILMEMGITESWFHHNHVVRYILTLHRLSHTTEAGSHVFCVQFSVPASPALLAALLG